jgi:hypothetical protein
MQNTPYTLEQALEALKNGQFSSLRDAEAKTGFPRATLSHHQTGRKSRSQANKNR